MTSHVTQSKEPYHGPKRPQITQTPLRYLTSFLKASVFAVHSTLHDLLGHLLQVYASKSRSQ